MPPPIAEFENIAKDYPDDWLGRRKVAALRGVSLSIGRGEVLGLLGPNRAGKTTLVKLLLSLCRPTAGAIRRFEKPVHDRSTLARVGYMHENHAFPRYLSATDLLRFYGGLALVPHDRLDGRVSSLLNRVGLADRGREPIARFSKGMIQRLGLAQALLNEPDLLVLDEPTEGLDLEGRQLLREVVREMRGTGRTVLLVSHVLPEVEQLCDRVAVLVAGKLAFTGTLPDLIGRTRPAGDGALESALGDSPEADAMNLPTAILSVRWLIWDTFRQSLASKLFWVLLAVSTVCIAVCLSVSVSGGLGQADPNDRREMLPKDVAQEELKKYPPGVKPDVFDVPGGELSIGFGLMKVPLARDEADPIRFLQVWLAGYIADTAGILLCLIWTAGFLPEFLEPAAVAVLLAKPVPRWSLLVGKYLGVLAFVFVQAPAFVGGTWLVLGLRTGVFDWHYWLCLPMLLLHFGVFFSFSTLLAVMTRNSAACVIGTLFFWMLCWGMNFAHHVTILAAETGTVSPAATVLLDVGYWLLPKPWDMNAVVFQSLQAQNFFGTQIELTRLEQKGWFHGELSILASVAFAAAMLALAAYEFVTTDY